MRKEKPSSSHSPWSWCSHGERRQRLAAIPCVVSRTRSALLGKPSQDGVWVSGSISTQCMNSSRLKKVDRLNQAFSEAFIYDWQKTTHGKSPVPPAYSLSRLLIYSRLVSKACMSHIRFSTLSTQNVQNEISFLLLPNHASLKG